MAILIAAEGAGQRPGPSLLRIRIAFRGKQAESFGFTFADLRHHVVAHGGKAFAEW